MISKVLQTSFTSGEISPRIYGRVDLDQYYSSAQKLVNFIPTPQGPIIRRAGSKYVWTLPEAENIRFIPFTYTSGQSFVLAFHSNGNMYVFFREGIIVNENGEPYSVAHNINKEYLDEVSFAQNGNTLYLAHWSFIPKKITRVQNDNWTIQNETFIAQPAQWKNNDYPSQVAFFEQRAVYAANKSYPRTLWFSRTALLNDFTKETEGKVLDDNAITYSLTDRSADRIKWIEGLDVLFLATDNGEFKVSSSAINEAITPSNIKISKMTGYGAHLSRAAILGTGMVYIQKSRRTIRFISTDQFGSYNNQDLLLLAQHLGKYVLKELAIQNEYATYLWVLTESGELLCCTYDKENKVLAWSTVILGGDKKVLSLAVTQEPDGSEALWLATKMPNDNKVYVDIIPKVILEPDTVQGSKFLDSYIENNSATRVGDTTMSGLDHLKGKEVGVFIDGWVHPNVIVSDDGTITLQDTGSHILVGLPYTSEFRSNTYQSQEVNTAGRIRRIFKVGITLIKSLGLKISAGGRTEEVYMGPTKIMNKAKELFTGVKKISLPADYDTIAQVTIVQDKPLPCVISNIIAYFNSSE